MITPYDLAQSLDLPKRAVEGVHVLAAVLIPDRWLLWLGVLFVLSVYYFPTGVVGRLRARALSQSYVPAQRSTT